MKDVEVFVAVTVFSPFLPCLVLTAVCGLVLRELEGAPDWKTRPPLATECGQSSLEPPPHRTFKALGNVSPQGCL